MIVTWGKLPRLEDRKARLKLIYLISPNRGVFAARYERLGKGTHPHCLSEALFGNKAGGDKLVDYNP